MLHTLRFSLQNAIYFIMLIFLVPVFFTFYMQGVLKFKLKLRCQKVKIHRSHHQNFSVLSCPKLQDTKLSAKTG
jgi:hypothetical protein